MLSLVILMKDDDYSERHRYTRRGKEDQVLPAH